MIIGEGVTVIVEESLPGPVRILPPGPRIAQVSTPDAIVTVAAPEVPTVRTDASVASVAVVLAEGPPGPAGPQGPPGSGGGGGAGDQVVLIRAAASTLSGHRAVTPLPDGTVDYCSNTDPGHIHAPIWITTSAAAAGMQITLIAFGEVAEPTWAWAPGDPVYLGANGVLTQTPPSAPAAVFLAAIGTATTPSALFVDREPSIVLA